MFSTTRLLSTLADAMRRRRCRRSAPDDRPPPVLPPRPFGG
ncbi:hypothetical protein [Dactylosporangium darangshiense]|nr:hypothetical protein [Dactylosporangium sp.]